MGFQYQPFPIQVEAHRAFLLDDYTRGLLLWSRRTGKTMWSLQHLMLAALLKQGQYHIVYKEYQHAETVAWNQYFHTLPKELINEKATNKTLLTIGFHYAGDPKTGPIKIIFPGGEVKEIMHDRSKPPSTIRLLGSDKYLSHLGGESNGMIFDEYQDQDPIAWSQTYKFFLATTDGWAIFMGTARDIDHWVELQDRAQQSDRWYFSKATWRANPKVKPEWIETERKEAEEKGELGVFLQETELIPFSQQGAVYPMFNKDIHVVKPEEVPAEGTDYVALDFGFAEGHPLAACFVRITRDDIWYQWDEIYGTGIQIDDFINELKIKMGDRKLTAIIADSARPDLIDYLASKALPVIPAPKKQNSIPAGIQLFAKRLRPKIQIIGEPKPNFYIANNCKKTIYEMTHYRYKEIKQDRHPSELPDKKFDHSCFVAGTLISTPGGKRPVETIKVGDLVNTPFGVSKVIGAGLTGKKKIKDYGIFKSTLNHKVLTQRGLVPMDSIRYDDFVWQENQNLPQKSFSLMEYLIAAILTPPSATTDFILNALLTRSLEAKLDFSTEMFGNSIMGRFLKECTSITKMDTMTTRFNRLNLLLQKSIANATKENENTTLSILKELENLLKSGIEALKEELGIVSTEKMLGKKKSGLKKSAKFAEKLTQRLSQIVANTVILTAGQQPSEDAEVFNLATEDGMYFANGVLVSNCDALRYLELFFKYGHPNQREKLPESTLMKEMNSYGLL